MSRTQLVLGGALLLQIALILIVRAPFAGASTATEARTLFPVLDAITPMRMEIRGSDDEKITLTRKSGDWSIDEIGGFPADAAKVDGLIDDLKSLTVRRPVVSTGRYHGTFMVKEDDHEARLKVWGEDGDDVRVDLILGTSPNYGITHARRAGEDEVYEIRGIAPYDVRAEADAWATRQLVDVEAGEVTFLSLTNESGSFELHKQDGVWTAAGHDDALDQDTVESLVGTASSMRLAGATGPVDPTAHGFESPAATVVLRWGAQEDAGSEITIRVGARPAEQDSKRFVTRSGFEFTGTVWESSVKRLLEEVVDDLHASADVSG